MILTRGQPLNTLLWQIVTSFLSHNFSVVEKENLFHSSLKFSGWGLQIKLTKDRLKESVYFEYTQTSQKRGERFLHTILTKGNKLRRGDKAKEKGFELPGVVLQEGKCTGKTNGR